MKLKPEVSEVYTTSVRRGGTECVYTDIDISLRRQVAQYDSGANVDAIQIYRISNLGRIKFLNVLFVHYHP